MGVAGDRTLSVQLEEDAMPLVSRSHFARFPDKLQLSKTIALSGMDFQDNASLSASIVNQTSGLNQLPDPDTGLRGNLPIAVPWARLHVGQFAVLFDKCGGIPFELARKDPQGKCPETL
jgi:hypothetical protein